MKWNEVVNLNEAFVPACDIKAIWLQGAYGSDKTHATMVVKEIFSQNLDGVKKNILNTQ